MLKLFSYGKLKSK